MPSADDEAPVERAPQVCWQCKKHKKGCDKKLPSCNQCVRKKKKCHYGEPPEEFRDTATLPTRAPLQRFILSGLSPEIRLSMMLMDSLSDVFPSNMLDLNIFQGDTTDSILYSQVCRIIQSSGQNIEDSTSRYFYGIHRWLPIMSQKRFRRRLLEFPTTPTAHFSLLVLSMCLITQFPSPDSDKDQDREVLYLATKILFTQVQVMVPPSSRLYLIQAALIIAHYEHAHGMLESAYLSIGTCARMAIAAGLDGKSSTQFPIESGNWLDQEERRCLWWAIMICDRVIGCTMEDRPLATLSPDKNDILPIEIEELDLETIDPQFPISRYVVSDTSAMGLGTFAREAQATYLLDQVLQISKMKELSPIHFSELSRLDAELQQFLSIVMEQCGGEWGVYCGSICGSIIALFALHSKILAQPDSSITLPKQNSQIALDTITRMIITIAYGFVANIPYFDIEILAPAVAHIAECAQRHAAIAPAFRDESWLKDLEILQTWLGYFNRRWVLAGHEIHRLNGFIAS